MLALIALAAGYGTWRALRAAFQSLRNVPRANDDMIFY
jgi:hypothetical protein